MKCTHFQRMMLLTVREREKWWPKGVQRLLTDPSTGGKAEQMLMQFYNDADMWRCRKCGWNEVYSVYARPRCRKCGASMKSQEAIH